MKVGFDLSCKSATYPPYSQRGSSILEPLHPYSAPRHKRWCNRCIVPLQYQSYLCWPPSQWTPVQTDGRDFGLNAGKLSGLGKTLTLTGRDRRSKKRRQARRDYSRRYYEMRRQQQAEGTHWYTPSRVHEAQFLLFFILLYSFWRTLCAHMFVTIKSCTVHASTF